MIQKDSESGVESNEKASHHISSFMEGCGYRVLNGFLNSTFL